LIGTVFAGLRAPKGLYVGRSEAPDLWRVWDEADRSKFAFRKLRIDQRMNASMGERYRFLGLFGREVTLTVGLPMLMMLDKPALTAVIAHEVAHDRLHHSRGLSRLAEFENCLGTLFEMMPPHLSFVGAGAYRLVGWMGTRVEGRLQTLSHQVEFEADALAASKQGQAAIARTLVMMAGLGALYDEQAVEPAHKGLMTGATVPASPYQRLTTLQASVREPSAVKAAAQTDYAKEPDPAASHPSLRQRQAALGFTDLSAFEALDEPASRELIPPTLMTRVLADFEAEWQNYAIGFMGLE
jgi:hypothetical protein